MDADVPAPSATPTALLLLPRGHLPAAPLCCCVCSSSAVAAGRLLAGKALLSKRSSMCKSGLRGTRLLLTMPPSLPTHWMQRTSLPCPVGLCEGHNLQVH